MSTVVQLPVRGRWAWDARGDSRAVRVSPHVRENVVNLSVWRDDICVGTVRLAPDDAAALVAGLTEGLARLSERPVDDATRMREMEDRLARLESRVAEPPWKTAATAVAAKARQLLGSGLPRVPGR
jgi:hypothetical protein